MKMPSKTRDFQKSVRLSLRGRPFGGGRQRRELARAAYPVIVPDASAEVLKLAVHPRGFVFVPLRHLPEIIDADPVEQLVQVRADAIDLFEIVRRAEGRLDQKI